SAGAQAPTCEAKYPTQAHPAASDERLGIARAGIEQVLQPGCRQPGKAQLNRPPSGGPELFEGRLAQDRGAEAVGLHEAAGFGDELQRKAFGHGEVEPVAPLAIVRPFAVGPEISYRRFYLDDHERAVAPERQDIRASSIGEGYLGERREAALRQRAGYAAADRRECVANFQHGLTFGQSAIRSKDGERSETTPARFRARCLAARQALFRLRRQEMGFGPACRRDRAQLALGRAECALQFLAQRLLQRRPKLRRAGLLEAARHLHRAGRRLHRDCRLRDLSPADAADPLAPLADEAISAGLARFQSLLPAAAHGRRDRQSRSTHSRRLEPLHRYQPDADAWPAQLDRHAAVLRNDSLDALGPDHPFGYHHPRLHGLVRAVLCDPRHLRDDENRPAADRLEFHAAAL